MKTEDFESVVDYTTVLSNFEGPIDLLLYLINQNEIAIEDVFVSEVTDQFLQYMRGLPTLDVEKVGEYLNIAASIIKIKARSLVPNLENDPELDAEIEAEKEELIRAIKLRAEQEFVLIKEETKKLKELETIGFYFKDPDKSVGETKIVYTDFHLDGLVAAFSALLLRKENEEADAEEREIPTDEFTVSDKIRTILEVFETEKSIQFHQLFSKTYRKTEVVTTFQALLELLKHQYLRVTQSETFGEITITANPDRNKEDPLGQIDEYN